MAMTDLAIVGRSLTSRWFATATTVLTVGVAVGLLLVLVSLRSAGEQAFARGTGNMHLLVSADSSPLNSVLNSVFYMGNPAAAKPLSAFAALRADPRVSWAIPVVQGDSFQGYPTLATTNEFFTSFEPARGSPWRFEQGAGFKNTFDVVLGAEAAAGTGLRVGDHLHLTHGTHDESGHAHEHDEFHFEISGILAPSATAHDRAIFTTTEATWLIHATDLRESARNPVAPTVQNLRDDEKVITGLYIRVKGRANTDAPPALQELYAELRKDGTITVAQPGSQVASLFKVVGGIDRIIFALAAAVLVSSSITIMLVLYQAMELRRRQVAVLRVLGASRFRVFMLALTEAAVIGIAASLLGVAVAFVGAHSVAFAVYQSIGLTISPSLDLRWVISIVAGATALACLAGIVPAAVAYRTDVLRSLRPIG
ncbi:MAG: ABC transporter permease [Phycisphaerales bacterium]|nr:ABC transporter permease [Phycisphaerales bacterium]